MPPYHYPYQFAASAARFLAARWRVGALVLVTALIWAAHYDRWTPASWRLPTDYSGDALEILARLQAAAEGDTVPLQPQVITRLGAPFGANWSAYPSSDLPLLWMLGQVARVTGVFPAANLALLLAAVSAALAFYGYARWLRVRWEWAMAGALLFAFTFQSFHRGLPHLLLAFSWTVPLSVLSCALVAGSTRLSFRSPGGWLCLGTAAAIGVGNPYVLFLHLQLLAWALVVQWLGARRVENQRVGAVALLVALAGFVMTESHVWLYATDTAAASPLVRTYGGTERYALKPVELFVPPATHRWEALAFFGHRYLRWSDWRGETFAPYLGLVGIAGLAALAGTAWRAVLRRRRVPGGALATGWVLAFASVGGVTNIIAFFTGLLVFRATNRFSVFVSALVLFFVVSRLSRWASRRPAWLSVAAAAIIAVVGLADQLPRGPSPDKQQRIAHRVAADAELGRWLEDVLPDGAPVFQLPVLMFPEATPPNLLTDYEHFRPYLATSTLRWSYGALRGRSRGRWQRDIEALPTRELVSRLERSGFAAMYFNRRGFVDRGEQLLGELKAIGRARYFESQSREQVVVLLEPAAQPEPPVARSLTFGRGWQNAPPGAPRWAYGPATMSFFNPYPRPVRLRVGLVLSSVGARHLSLRVNGEPVREAQLDERGRTLALRVTARPGVNRFDLATPEPAVRLSEERGQLRAFAVHETRVRVEPDALAAVH